MVAAETEILTLRIKMILMLGPTGRQLSTDDFDSILTAHALCSDGELFLVTVYSVA